MATITRRGKKWAARIRMQGESLSKSFVTKGQAQAWATQTEAAIMAGTLGKKTDLLLFDALERYKNEVTPTKATAVNESYVIRIHQRQDIAKARLSDVTTEMLAQYRDSELQRIKPASVLRYLTVLGAVFETAHTQWQWISNNPYKALKKPSGGQPRDKTFTPEEIEAITKQLEFGTEVMETIRDAFLFALETAMRAGEIRGLEWSMIVGNVAELPKTKNGDRRRVPLSTRAVQILDTRRHHTKPFKLVRETLVQRFKVHAERAGVYDKTFHDTRHTAITRLAKVLTPFELARMVGHRNLSQTLAYFNESAESMADKLG